MGKRQRAWAKLKRVELMMALGGYCKRCNATDDLTFDCIIPQGDKHHKGGASERICFYRFHHSLGNVQILCHKCNSKKAAQEFDDYDMSWQLSMEQIA